MSESQRDGVETAYWHPFSDMAVVKQSRLEFERAEDVWIWSTEGDRYLDATASLWYSNVGHGRAEIADAVREQLAKLDAYSTFGDMSNGPAERLCRMLAERSPMPDSKFFLVGGGGEAIDTACKIARQYHIAIGRPDRMHILSRTNGYHGTNGYGTSIGGIEANRADFGPLVGGTGLVMWDSLSDLEEKIHAIGPDKVAAFFAEPVIGAGGVLPPPDGYLEGAAELCREHGILFIADAVICGFGRLGNWFGIERWDVVPDMITFAKGVTSGYTPLGGVAVSGRVAEPFWSEPGRTLRHGPTYSGHPAVCAAAVVNIDILEREKLLERALKIERWLDEHLSPLAEHDLVGEVRAGVGALAAVELSPDFIAAGGATAQLAAGMRRRGVLVRALGTAIAASPPLTIEPGEVERIAVAARESLDELAESA